MSNLIETDLTFHADVEAMIVGHSNAVNATSLSDEDKITLRVLYNSAIMVDVLNVMQKTSTPEVREEIAVIIEFVQMVSNGEGGDSRKLGYISTKLNGNLSEARYTELLNLFSATILL